MHKGELLQININEFAHSRGCVASLMFSQLINEFILPLITQLIQNQELAPKSGVAEYKTLHDIVPGGDASLSDYPEKLTDTVYNEYVNWKKDRGEIAPASFYQQALIKSQPSTVKDVVQIYCQNETRYMLDPFLNLSFAPNTSKTTIIIPADHADAIYGSNYNASLEPVGLGLNIDNPLIRNNTSFSPVEAAARDSIKHHYQLLLKVMQSYHEARANLSTQKDFMSWLEKQLPLDMDLQEDVAQLLKNYAEFKTQPEKYETGTLTPAFMAFQSDRVRDLSALHNEPSYPNVFYDKFHEDLFMTFYKSQQDLLLSTYLENAIKPLPNNNNKNFIRKSIDGIIPLRYPFSGLLNSIGIKSLRQQELSQRMTSGRSRFDPDLRHFLNTGHMPANQAQHLNGQYFQEFQNLKQQIQHFHNHYDHAHMSTTLKPTPNLKDIREQLLALLQAWHQLYLHNQQTQTSQKIAMPEFVQQFKPDVDLNRLQASDYSWALTRENLQLFGQAPTFTGKDEVKSNSQDSTGSAQQGSSSIKSKL